MKSLAAIIFFFLYTTILFAQEEITLPTSINQVENYSFPKYKLYPTQNYWTFIKLDTSTGKMWQVHFSINEEGYRGEVVLNPLTLVTGDVHKKGRFVLKPTENAYNFLLLDQIDGVVYQVQWSMEEETRGIVAVIE